MKSKRTARVGLICAILALGTLANAAAQQRSYRELGFGLCGNIFMGSASDLPDVESVDVRDYGAGFSWLTIYGPRSGFLSVIDMGILFDAQSDGMTLLSSTGLSLNALFILGYGAITQIGSIPLIWGAGASLILDLVNGEDPDGYGYFQVGYLIGVGGTLGTAVRLGSFALTFGVDVGVGFLPVGFADDKEYSDGTLYDSFGVSICPNIRIML